jgi:hypothetical protein
LPASAEANLEIERRCPISNHEAASKNYDQNAFRLRY